jgi:glycosyltransferase involved in cell wall biosynthesis
MFCSAVIPTIGRSTLSRAVYSVLDQTVSHVDFEIIVVNDSGQPLPEMEWQHSECVHIITTQRRERSVARNTGAAIAQGKYLYFLDDDDIMLPGALQAFWELAGVTNAVWLYGSYQVVDNDGNLIDEFHPDLTGNVSAYLIAGEGIPFQASLLRTTGFYSAGEFDVYFSVGTQDRDLARRVSLLGDVAKTPALITQIRVGRARSSTNWSILPKLDRMGREKAFSQPGVFARLWDSAEGSNYLHGRVSRAYLASSVWNLKRKNILIALSRLVSLAAFALPYVLSSEFWLGIRDRVQPLGEIRRIAAPSGNKLIPIAIVIGAVSILIPPIMLLYKRVRRFSRQD